MHSRDRCRTVSQRVLQAVEFKGTHSRLFAVSTDLQSEHASQHRGQPTLPVEVSILNTSDEIVPDDAAPESGWVYVLSNPSFVGMVKVGWTDRDVPSRIRELSNSTAVPTPFVWEYGVRVTAARFVEQASHRNLADCRVPNREFFTCSVVHAIVAVADSVGKRQVIDRHDRQEVEAEAGRIRGQRELAKCWKHSAETEIKKQRTAIHAGYESPKFATFFLGYATTVFLGAMFVFEVKVQAGLVVLSAILGGILAAFHHGKADAEHKRLTNHEGRLDELTTKESAVRGAYERTLDQISAGKDFAELEPALPQIIGTRPPPAHQALPSRPSEPTGALRSNEPQAPALPARLPRPESNTTTPTSTAANRPPAQRRNFGCDRCGKTVDVAGTIDCWRRSCPARALQSESPPAKATTPIELAGWQDPTTKARTASPSSNESHATPGSRSNHTASASTTPFETRYCAYCRSQTKVSLSARGETTCLKCRNTLYLVQRQLGH